jgi:hypothetical protein
VADDRRRGPGSMSEDERRSFLAARPSGAICTVDDEGRLFAVPARVLEADDAILHVELADADLDSALDHERQACIVADTFETYDGIRGVIARGPAVRTDQSVPAVVAVTMKRTTTFTFAQDRPPPESAQAVPD